VLVLDDDGTIAEIAAAVLVDGYEVVAASHLDEGLRMVESEHPDLILVDLDLPGATGFIPKPISEPQLRSEVAAVLQHRAALVDHRA